MCIRDSILTGGTPLGVRNVKLRFTCQEGNLCAGCGVPDRCLLYTSDAADERSSVDLGGRRIIKKKKTIHTRRETSAHMIARKTIIT